MFHREAKAILDRWNLELAGKPASTGKVAYRNPRASKQASSLKWWTEAGVARQTTERTTAYLEAYREIVGSSRIPTEGISLDDGYLYIDKGVVRFAISKKLISFDADKIEFIIHRTS